MSNNQNRQYKVEVDKTKCISAASCVSLAPQTFKLDENNKSGVISQEADSDEVKLQVAQACPAGAIKVTNKDTGEQVWPKDS